MYTHEPKLLTTQNSAMKIIKLNTNAYELTERHPSRRIGKNGTYFFNFSTEKRKKRTFTRLDDK